MSSLDYTIIAFDDHTMSYVVIYNIAGQTKKITCRAIRSDDDSVDAEKTTANIESTIHSLESPEAIPTIPNNVDSLIGHSDSVQVTSEVI